MVIKLVLIMCVLIYLMNNKSKVIELFKSKKRKKREREELMKRFYKEEPLPSEIDPNIVYKNRHRCKVCGNENYTNVKQGFSVGKAIIGDVLLGPIGLAAGSIGSGNIDLYCTTCGTKKHKVID